MAEIKNWAPLKLTCEVTVAGVRITLTTDTPCHLWLRWTKIKPLTHPEPLMRRGVSLPNATRWCFVAFHENEQLEPGDTYIHTYIKEPWAVCETRYFYLIGKIGGVESPSASPIFNYHREEAPTTCFIDGKEPPLTCFVDGL